jgi:hypothetical protein
MACVACWNVSLTDADWVQARYGAETHARSQKMSDLGSRQYREDGKAPRKSQQDTKNGFIRTTKF